MYQNRMCKYIVVNMDKHQQIQDSCNSRVAGWGSLHSSTGKRGLSVPELLNKSIYFSNGSLNWWSKALIHRVHS